jgi:MinD-like ATPase involved in chromosome partitioning or flagellar assembly
MKTFWTTFYSYKGGVGRSLALANVAALLAQRGHRVVLLDFDLEAPGLDTFAEFKDAKQKPGIVEYVAEYQRTRCAPEIAPFLHPVQLPEHLRGKLWIMPAGCKTVLYSHLLARIQWAELFAEAGGPFVENWKLSIEQEVQPDYVLIDSRTGLTEIGGVCTTAFPDLVVLLFGLNEQNVEGTATVARHIREADLQRPLQLHFVATPVPNLPPEKQSLLSKRIDAAESTLGVEIGSNVIRYWPPAALTERLFVLDKALREPGLIQDHKLLCGKITELNRNGLDFLTSQAEEAIAADDPELGERVAAVLAKEFPNRPEAIFLRSRLARLDGNAEEALKLGEQAVAMDPLYGPACEYVGAQYRRAKQFEKLELLYERILSYDSCVPRSRTIEVLTSLAELRMSKGDYLRAADHYAELRRLAVPNEEDGSPVSALVHRFNAAESARRAGNQVSLETWKKVVECFESFPAAAGLPTMEANHCQAMHIPYALVGDLEKAKLSLRKADLLAEGVTELEQIFSVRDYRNVSRDEFRATNQELLDALERGKLWDGTKLVANE